MATPRVDLGRRSRVVHTDYCPRCLTATERVRTRRSLRMLRRLVGVPLSARFCSWCGWEGWRLHRASGGRLLGAGRG